MGVVHMSVESIVRKAKRFEKQGQVGEALAVCEAFLASFPSNRRIQQQARLLRDQSAQGRNLPPAQEQQLKQAFKAGAYETLQDNLTALVRLFPESYFLWNLLGATHLRCDRPDDAADAFAKAIALDAHKASARVGLGDVHKAKGDQAPAVACYAAVLNDHPNHLEALNNLGTLLSAMGAHDDAVHALTKARQVAPNNHVILHNLGNVYREVDQLPQAEECLKKAVALAPHFVDGRYNLGLVQSLQGKLPEAVESFDAVLKIAPSHDPARIEKLHQMAHMCDWHAMADFAQQPEDFGSRGGGTVPFGFLALEDHPQRQRARSECYAKRFAAPAAHNPFAKVASPSERLRIGYFSADFHNHATMYLMGGLFEQHDPKRFEIIAYSFGPKTQDPARKRILANTSAFHDVGDLPAPKIAELAQANGLDIAVDLKGYTGNSRPEIFAQRPAPIQISWLGYPSSMGSVAYDYVIADPVVLPPDQRDGFSENVIYMPWSYQVNDNRREISERCFTRQDCGLPPDGFVFCCFNNSYKITPDEFAVWMRLLAACEGSVLWLLRANTWAEANLKQQAAARGICANRLIFADRLPVAEHLARQRLADLFLDTFACNAHTTASDALWAGVPIVTKAGAQFAARVCASLLSAVNLPDLVTHSTDEYEALALQLARDPACLAACRAHLAKHKEALPLFDTQMFTRHLEQAYVSARAIHRAGQGPRDFHVAQMP